MSLRVVNIVATFSLNTNIDLKQLSHKYFKAIYKPSRFGGLIYKLKLGTALIFSNGSCVIAGAKSEENIKSVIRIITRMVSSKPSEYRIRNIVATCDLRLRAVKNSGTIFNLSIIKEKAPKASYEPERYSALVMDLGVKAIIFHNGKINFTGAKDFEELNNAYNYILKFLSELKFIQ